MKLALSTNWCNRRIDDGAKIAETALSLGFDELELGFRTPIEQVAGFKSMLSRIPVRSIHAFCPVPVSAPAGHPELFKLANFAEEERAMAKVHVVSNIRFAAEIGAETVVLHAGRVAFSSLFKVIDSQVLRTVLEKCDKKTDAKKYSSLLKKAKALRRKHGLRQLSIFKKTLEAIVPVLDECGVTLALENLPYLEGFPNEEETVEICKTFEGGRIKGWFDTGHHRVRVMHGWIEDCLPDGKYIAGMHLNDVEDFCDDHFAPGTGKVDFAKLEDLARSVRHVVFEPNSNVTEETLSGSVKFIRSLWKDA